MAEIPELGELLEQAKNNPSIQALIDKITGAGAEDAESLINKTTRPADVQAAYNGIPELANKSAEESAQVFQAQPYTPNFTLGESSQTAQPNFRLQGEPYSGNVPETVPKIGGVPAVSDMSQMRDVSPILDETGKAESTATSPELEDQSKRKLTTAEKIALGAGGVGLGLGTLKVLQKDDDEDQNNSDQGSPNDMAARQQAALESVGARQPASQEEDEEDNDDEETSGHQPTKVPTDEAPKKSATDLDAVKSAMSKLLNFGTTDENKDNLASVLQQQQDRVTELQRERAGALIAAGLTRTRPNYDLYNQEIKEAGLPVEQYEMKQKYQANDPNSGISKGMRDYIQQNLGIKVSDGATASQMGQILPMVYKDVEAKQAQASHTADLQQRLQEQQLMANAHIQAAKEQKQGQMAMAQANKDIARQDQQNKLKTSYDFKTGDALQRFRGNPGLQNDLRAIQAADQALNTINNPQWKGDYNNIPGPVNEMLNTDLATIYSRGAASDNVIKELSNPTYMKAYENFMAKVGNHPTPAQQGAFIAQNKNLFQDLRDGSQNRVNEHYRQILNTQGRLGTPESRESYRQEFLPSDVYDKTGRLIPAHQLSDNELKQQWLKLQQAKGKFQ